MRTTSILYLPVLVIAEKREPSPSGTMLRRRIFQVPFLSVASAGGATICLFMTSLFSCFKTKTNFPKECLGSLFSLQVRRTSILTGEPLKQRLPPGTTVISQVSLWKKHNEMGI